MTESRPWTINGDKSYYLASQGYERRLAEKIIFLSSDLRGQLEAREIICADEETTRGNKAVFDLVDQLLDEIPDLNVVIHSCIDEVVVLTAPNDETDISHSEPRWLNRIFVSVPPESAVHDLRVAEAVVHEAMHLNLTYYERLTPLVKKETLISSPWRTEPRPTSGILHGAYVFCCVSKFFGLLAATGSLNSERNEFVVGRQKEIASQLATIDVCSFRDNLTIAGCRLLEHLVSLSCGLTTNR